MACITNGLGGKGFRGMKEVEGPLICFKKICEFQTEVLRMLAGRLPFGYRFVSDDKKRLKKNKGEQDGRG